jgi:hypothetical protein
MDATAGRRHTRIMSETPLTVPVPQRGGVVVARDVSGRVLRINGHPESGRVVLSIWQGPSCISTLRLAPEDVPEVCAALVRAAVPPAGWVTPPPDRPDATVTTLPVRAPAGPSGPAPARTIGSLADDVTALARTGWRRARQLLGARDPKG